MLFRKARWSNPDHTQIDCELDHPALGWLPYNADKNDTDDFGRAAFYTIVSQEDPMPFHEYVPTLEQRRAEMVCTPLQGRLALGQERWEAAKTAIRSPDTPWAMQQAFESASDWRRNSQMIDELAWLIGLTPEETDELFIKAMETQV